MTRPVYDPTHHAAKPESYNYQTIHSRVNNVRGKASIHKCQSCAAQADDWAHVHGTDPRDTENYKPLCRSCHTMYDGPLRGENNGAAILTEDDVREIRRLLQEGRLYQREIGEMFGVHQMTISQIKTRKNWAWLD